MLMSDSYLSLVRWKRHSFYEGEVYQLAGILKNYTFKKITLKNQNIEIEFNLNQDFFSDENEKKSLSYPMEKPGQKMKSSFSLDENIKTGDHLLLEIKFSQDAHRVLKIKKILSPSKPTLFWNRQVSESWFYFLEEIKNFFLSIGLSPVETPSLVDCPGTETYIQFFSTVQKINSQQKKIWLSSSPEMHLKKLLCRGATDIFEIHKSYRNNEVDSLHLREFYLLEWYRAYAFPFLLVEDLENLLKYLKDKKIISFPIPSFHQISVKKLFQEHCQINLTPKSKPEDLIPALKKWNIPFEKDWSFEDLFYLLFLNRVEPKLNPDVPTIIYDYPPSLRAYSKLTNEGWACRFEFYWKGLELANAFYEVNDPKEQREIFEMDLKSRKNKTKSNDEDLKPDYNLLEEMEAGMPSCSGIALGLERLFMAAYGHKDISKIHPF